MPRITRILLALSLLSATALQAEPVSNHFTTSDGVNIHYLTDGDAANPPLVLVHGFTSSARGNWYNTQIAPQLAQHYRVIAIDMRNHGESQVVQERQPGIVRDVLELLDHLQLEQVHMHGYSMGGATTLAILAYAPQRLLTASAGGMGVSDLPGNVAPDADFDWNAALTERVPVQFPMDLTEISLPVMTINGSDDAPFPKTVRMTRELKNYTNVILPGYGHMNAMQAGTGYVENLLFFLQLHD